MIKRKIKIGDLVSRTISKKSISQYYLLFKEVEVGSSERDNRIYIYNIQTGRIDYTSKHFLEEENFYRIISR